MGHLAEELLIYYVMSMIFFENDFCWGFFLEDFMEKK